MTNKRIFISGASRGIGAAIATTFASNGYELYLTCNKGIEALETLALSLRDTYQVAVHSYQIDMSDSIKLEAFMQKMPSFDVVVNNVGISHVDLITNTSLSQWNHIINTNLTSAFIVSNAVLPDMIQRKNGVIINISSVWGNIGASCEVAYSTSKAALNGFTKSLAKELAPCNIRVNAIACGLIHTKMNSCFSDEELADIIQDIPAQRIGEPEEVAQLCLQLAIAPSYLTGQILTLDGGWT